ncbi:hypothetical protein FACS1894187_15690 [Synergistales bacterium]|nr:hypothetical protein FACS1894187_15690 [Synergistales bacterium]
MRENRKYGSVRGSRQFLHSVSIDERSVETVYSTDVMLQDRILTYSEEAAKKAAKEAELKGIEKGIEKKAFDVARKMLARGMTLLEVAEIAELPIDKLQTLAP